MKVKKVIKIVVLTFICIIILSIDFLFGWLDSEFSNSFIGCKFYNELGSDYYKREKYVSSDFNGTSFQKYYYHQDDYTVICKGRITCSPVKGKEELVKNYIKTSLNNLHELDNNIEIDFDYDVITSDDYYYVEYDEGMTFLYYYDAGEHILYRTYFYE